MKKVLSFFLALCMLISLALTVGASPAFAEVQSAEDFAQLKQQAEAGDASAMVEVANIYSRGNFNSGVSRDFEQALAWYLRAADAGNDDVALNIATIYEKGSAGARDYEAAYEWYLKAAENGSKKVKKAAKTAMAQDIYADLHWLDSIAQLRGTYGEYGNLGGRYGTPFYLDKPVKDCTEIDMQLNIIEYRGWPFGLYGLYAMNTSGNWVEVSRFEIKKEQAEEGAEPKTYNFALSSPLSFKALGVVLLEDGMDFNLKHRDDFFVDKTLLSQYSEKNPAPEFTPSDADCSENSATFYTTAWSNPYPEGWGG